MKIVVAPDKFKGSLTSLQFCRIVEEQLKASIPSATVVSLPMADGGDGTVSVLQYYLGGEYRDVRVHNPLHKRIKANYLLIREQQTAYIEMAEASGLNLLLKDEQNPMHTSTYGFGELIKDAILQGAKKIILGIGGSATNDGGMGMARALGYRFYDKMGNELYGKGKDLKLLHHIKEDTEELLKDIEFTVACDVANLLYGSQGASYMYAQQKGATTEEVKHLDEGLQNFNEVIKKHFSIDLQTVKGSGASGGLGGGCQAFLNAKLQSGIALVQNIAKFSEHIKNADWVISGEGRLDTQTFQGKVIKGIADKITTQKLALFCGQITLSKEQLSKYPVAYSDAILNYTNDKDKAIKNSKKYLVKMILGFLTKKLYICRLI